MQCKFWKEMSIHCITELLVKDNFCSKNLQIFKGSKKGLKKRLETIDRVTGFTTSNVDSNRKTAQSPTRILQHNT